MKPRDGVVLVLALLCLLALEVTAVGLHYITLQELRTVQASGRDGAVRRAARNALSQAIVEWPAVLADTLALHARVEIAAVSMSPTIAVRVDIERIAPSLFLLRSVATTNAGERAGIGALIASGTAEAVASTLTRAVRTSGQVQIGPGAGVIGGIDTARAGSAGIASLTLDRLVRAAALATASGDAGMRLLTGATAVIPNGADGVIVVDGDAVMIGGNFHGVLAVTGSLSLSAGAQIDGAVIMGSQPLTLDHAAIRRDSAAIVRAAATPWLHGPFAPRGRIWLPLF